MTKQASIDNFLAECNEEMSVTPAYLLGVAVVVALVNIVRVVAA